MNWTKYNGVMIKSDLDIVFNEYEIQLLRIGLIMYQKEYCQDPNEKKAVDDLISKLNLSLKSE